MISLRVCSWNINFGIRLQKVLEEMVNDPESKKLDFLFLQETGDSEPVRRILGKNYAYLESIAQTVKGRPQGNAILWNMKKFKLLRAFTLTLPSYRLTKIPRKERIILNRVAPQKRIALMVEGLFNKMTVRLYCIHLDVLGWAHKREQLGRILENDQNLPDVDLVLICGDFNTISRRLSNLDKLTDKFGYVESSRDIKHTFQHKLVRNRKLDMIFLKSSPGVKLTSQVWARRTAASDHLPIFASYEVFNNSR